MKIIFYTSIASGYISQFRNFGIFETGQNPFKTYSLEEDFFGNVISLVRYSIVEFAPAYIACSSVFIKAADKCNIKEK